MGLSYTSKSGGHADFPTITTGQSTPFYFNNDTVVGVKVFITETIVKGTIKYYIGHSITETGTITWEELDRTNGEIDGTQHNLDASGVYFLHWKASSLTGNSVSKITIEVIR